MIRLVLSQQWAVALIVCAHDYGTDEDEWDRAYSNVTEHIAQMWPCAADVVDAFIKEQENR